MNKSIISTVLITVIAVVVCACYKPPPEPSKAEENPKESTGYTMKQGTIEEAKGRDW